jgi:hypothetical protein
VEQIDAFYDALNTCPECGSKFQSYTGRRIHETRAHKVKRVPAPKSVSAAIIRVENDPRYKALVKDKPVKLPEDQALEWYLAWRAEYLAAKRPQPPEAPLAAVEHVMRGLSGHDLFKVLAEDLKSAQLGVRILQQKADEQTAQSRQVAASLALVTAKLLNLEAPDVE